MSQQNLLGVGFDIPELQAEAKIVEQIVEQLYAKLRGYDNVKLQPIDVTGLTQLTQAIQNQQQQLNGLTTSMNNLVTAMNNYNTTLAQSNTTTQNSGTVTGATTQAVNANTAAITANTAALNTNKNANASNQAQQKKSVSSQTDLYRQLVQKQEEIALRWKNSLIMKDPPHITKGLEKDLQQASAAVDEINVAFNRATSSGIMNASRGLSTFFGGIRQLAYILPGLGIAGIFNLAFEAIGSCIEALGLFDDEVQKTIEYNDKLAESAKTAANAMISIADAAGELSKKNVDAAKAGKDLADAQGQNFAQQIDDTDK